MNEKKQHKRRVLILDDEFEVRKVLSAYLTSKKGGYEVAQAATIEEALSMATRQPFDHIISDVYLGPEDDPDVETGLDFFRRAKAAGVESNIIIMSGKANVDIAMEAIHMGAVDYFHKPITAEHLFFILRRAEEQARLKKENALLRNEINQKYSFKNIIAKSPAMGHIFDVIKKVKDYKTTVLVTGESGTGKELVAKALHYNSIRRNGPFIPVNCGGIPENLLESEFFGHVKGAFTDAVRGKRGLFEEANGGTLFLDELGDLPLTLQVKLLRVLQEEEIRPVGDTRTIKVNVRIVAATAADLSKAVAEGKFREDLYYRINVLSIVIPPLRERKEDIRLLVDHFLEKYNKRLNMKIKGISPEAMQMILDYQWPGNVRELENLMERAMVLSDGKIIKAEDLPPSINTSISKENVDGLVGLDATNLSIKKASKVLERELIKRALERTKGNKTQACHLLEISLPALLYKMKEYGLTPST